MRCKSALLSTALLLLSLGCGPNRFVKKGDGYMKDNRPDAAARSYQQALDLDPTYTNALRGLAAAHLARHHPVRAIVPAQRASKTGDVEARALLATALIGSGRASDAIDVVRTGLEEHPEHTDYQRLLVLALMGGGSVDDAAVAADEMLINHTTGQTRALHAWALARADRSEDATAMAIEAVTIAPEDPMVQADAAAVFKRAGRKTDYEQARNAALSFLPSAPTELLQDAKRMRSDGNREGAIRVLSRAHAVYPSSAEAARILGLLYKEQKSWTRAVESLNTAIGLPPYSDAPTVSGVRVARGGDPLKQGKLREKITEMANSLGEAYTQLGKPTDAALAWRFALSNQESVSADDWLGLAKAWETAGDMDNMGRAAKKAVEIDANHAGAHHMIAHSLLAARNIDWAIRHARKAWESAPEDLEIILFLGGLYEERGERRVAREVYRDGMRHHPSDARVFAAFERVGGYRR